MDNAQRHMDYARIEASALLDDIARAKRALHWREAREHLRAAKASAKLVGQALNLVVQDLDQATAEHDAAITRLENSHGSGSDRA